ncbi:AAA family ATPase [Alysiella filiformis]|uniref:AAA domain-containing protein, putative AbiEii toxin, Type IV TA system n=1 Tax=Alysiella filiformis DSM 16848 TaxID=1120981 RepID=A0A286E836_9NEIS|nr:AAA family ATPase [Alysiella filiformis]QMT32034.1 ATP-binding protein [Alysiella filiformis]UBQ57057.1 ATP-binding protein [Alysiella filiformis DSM 16848]SOD67039.1 AAA domain-containing protein, putative AbiEii toxin, Type IV TA system [Alysiella filiformis DSM 16848]
MNDLLNGVVRFEGVKGVGTIEVDFAPNQRVYTFIGANGVGKTKLLECLFAVLFLTNSSVLVKGNWIKTKYLPFKQVRNSIFIQYVDESEFLLNKQTNYFSSYVHDCPIVYLAAQGRGGIQNTNSAIPELESHEKRREKYLNDLFGIFNNDYTAEKIKNLNMDTNVKEWIIQRANSANEFQAQENNRKVELEILISLLNKIDNRIDEKFLEKSGYKVFIKVENEKRELSDLSSGFTSILKMVQSIIAGYSYFTNEQQIARVRGVVLIDEIESHLHNEWQVKIIPLLKKLFPNTTFLISTHSSLVISQLAQGEAYRLKRNLDDGVVYGELIEYPNNMAFVDLLNEAFDVNLNQLKIERLEESEQTEVKQALLSLVQKKLAKLETK